MSGLCRNFNFFKSDKFFGIISGTLALALEDEWLEIPPLIEISSIFVMRSMCESKGRINGRDCKEDAFLQTIRVWLGS